MARPVAGVRKQTLILTLPGSPKGAKENLEAVLKLLPHACVQAAGAASRPLHVGGVKKLEQDAGVSSKSSTSGMLLGSIGFQMLKRRFQELMDTITIITMGTTILTAMEVIPFQGHIPNQKTDLHSRMTQAQAQLVDTDLLPTRCWLSMTHSSS